jgi:putative methyltransferase (TIGR04325 family)
MLTWVRRSDRIRFAAKKYLPPVVVRRLPVFAPPYGFGGDYPSWESARRASRGYDARNILEVARTAALKVKSGEQWGERDSMFLPEGHYPFQVLAGLLRAALESSGVLRVADFGGSFASTYFVCRKFLPARARVEWSVIEQPEIVEMGRRDFADGELRFFSTIDECLAVGPPQVLLLSSVLPYLESPRAFLGEIIAKGFQTIIVDRTYFFREDLPDRLTVQQVHPAIYEGSYPAWILNRSSFLDKMREAYDCLSEFEPIVDEIFDVVNARCLGFIFVKRQPEAGSQPHG